MNLGDGPPGEMDKILFNKDVLWEDRPMPDGTTIRLPRPVPNDYRAKITFNDLNAIGHAPGYPRYWFQTTMIQNEPMMRRAAEVLLTRSCWAVTCLAEAGRVSELDPFFPIL